jgi:hypothetical protein
MRRFFQLGLAVTVLTAMASGTAFATPVWMKISTTDSTNTVHSLVITGTGANPSTVAYSNSDFYGWNLESFLYNINQSQITVPQTVGTSYSPSVTPFALDLQTLSAACALSSCNALTISISDVGFTSPLIAGGLLSNVGGTLTGNGSVTQTAYFDPLNRYFGQTVAIPAVAVSGPGAVSGSAAGGGPWPWGDSTAYSLTLTDTLTANCSGSNCATFSLDNNITSVPEPGTLALFGAGLLGIGLLVRRRRATREG